MESSFPTEDQSWLKFWWNISSQATRSSWWRTSTEVASCSTRTSTSCSTPPSLPKSRRCSPIWPPILQLLKALEKIDHSHPSPSRGRDKCRRFPQSRTNLRRIMSGGRIACLSKTTNVLSWDSMPKEREISSNTSKKRTKKTDFSLKN